MRLSVRITKRLIDLVASSIGLIVCAPLFPLIAAAVYIDSPGPVFFSQTRAGRLLGVRTEQGRRRFDFAEFSMHKFRSMRVDAEAATGAVIAAKDDPRVTRLGRFLRRSRLDELPQLWDVFRGKMSLVGPRPERPELLENLAFAIPFFEERMRDVKPGITGLAQVNLTYSGGIVEGSEIEKYKAVLQNPFGLEEAEGSIADDMRVKLLYDLAYLASLEKYSAYLAMELGIIFRTPIVMLLGKGR